MSARPGMRYLPRPSIRRAPRGTRTVAVLPTASIRPSRTTTVASRSTLSGDVIGITVTLVTARTPGVSAPRDPGGWSDGGVRPAAMRRAAQVASTEVSWRAGGWGSSRSTAASLVGFTTRCVDCRAGSA